MIKMVDLDSIAEIVRGVTFSKADGTSTPEDGRLPVIRAGSIQSTLLVNEGQIWVPKEKVKSHQMIKKNDIIMCTSSGSASLVGKCAIASEDWTGSFGAFCAGIRVDEKLCIPSYLYYFLSSPTFRNWSGASDGANIKNIRASELAKFQIPLPPLETQKKIAAVLEKADQLRKDCKLLEQELNSLAQSVFIDMFGDPVKNPKGWDKKELLSLCSKVTDGTHQSPEWAETGVPFLFISNVRNGKVDFDSGKYITRSCYEELTRTSPIEVDDILYTTVGSYGHVALVKDNFPDFCFQRHIAHIKPDPNKVIPEFLFYQLQTSGVKHLADLAVKGIAQKTLNLKDLKKFEMIVPPEEKQLELINYMVHQYQALNELEQMKSDYEMLFSSLMQKAFKGELDL